MIIFYLCMQISQIEPDTSVELISSMQTLLNENYVIEEKRTSYESHLERCKSSNETMDIEAWVDWINKKLQEAHSDKHVGVVLPEKYQRIKKMLSDNHQQPLESAISALSDMNKTGSHQFGYIQLRHMMANQGTVDQLHRVMSLFRDSSGIIIDLTACGGGDAEFVSLLTSYFFAEPMHLLSSVFGKNKPKERWTTPNKLSKIWSQKPVFILTSNHTFSAAESFSFAMSQSGRATLIGEPTGGGGHMNDFFDLPMGLGLSVSIGRTYNPKTGEGWEGKGVQPNIECTSEDALNVFWKNQWEDFQEEKPFPKAKMELYKAIQLFTDAIYTGNSDQLPPLANNFVWHTPSTKKSSMAFLQDVQTPKWLEQDIYQNRIIRFKEINSREATVELVLRRHTWKMAWINDGSWQLSSLADVAKPRH